ncbi:MAG: alpha/beta hydrolase, partial [Microvirga sp.]
FGADAVGGLVIVGARAKQVPSSLDTGQTAIAQSCADDLETRLRARLTFLRACYGVPLSPEDMAEIAACAMLVPPEVLRHFAGRPMDYEALLSALPIPVRVLHGALDPVCPLDEVMRIGEINRSTDISVYKDLGHAPFFEDPGRFNADLVSFVTRCQAPGQGGARVPMTGAVVA